MNAAGGTRLLSVRRLYRQTVWVERVQTIYRKVRVLPYIDRGGIRSGRFVVGVRLWS